MLHIFTYTFTHTHIYVCTHIQMYMGWVCACELLRSVNCQIKKHRIRVISPKTEAKQTVLSRYFSIHSQVHNTHTHEHKHTHTQNLLTYMEK